MRQLQLLPLLLAAFASPAVSSPRLPHILLVLVDDFGWNNVGYHRYNSTHPAPATNAEVVTPTIDNLAQSGIKLERHYAYSYCSPSRAALQSGRLPVHVSFVNDDPAISNPKDPISGYAGIPRNMTGLATKMRSAGYRTHMTGKWDAGMATWDHTPMGRGYESWLGYYHHANDYYTQKLGTGTTLKQDVCKKYNFTDLWDTERGGGAKGLNGTAYEDEMFTNRSIAVIDKHAAQHAAEPLFLFHSFHIVHTPLEVPPAYESKFSFLTDLNRRKYAAMVQYMDEALGKIVGRLEHHGMWENTLMVLSSDNGGPIYGSTNATSKVIPHIGHTFGGASNLPLKGGKLSDWEGGVRVSAFVSGGAVPPRMRGTTLHDYIHISDWYTTFCAIAGVSPFDTRAEAAHLPPVDGINQWPLISGLIAAGHGNRTEMHISENTLIQGRLKLITGGFEYLFPRHPLPFVPMDGYWNGYGPASVKNELTKYRYCGALSGGCLYDIFSDPHETNDISKSHKDDLARMKARLKELNKGLFLPNRGKQDPKACDAAIAHGGYYGPFVQ